MAKLEPRSAAADAVSRPVPKQKSTAREYAEALGVALLLALLIRMFVVQAFKIPSGSMLPTLQIGDHILVNKFIYGARIEIPLTQVSLGQLPGLHEPRPGDVIVFIWPKDRSKDFIKRVIAVGGQAVEVRSKQVHINGKPWDDPHATFTPPRGGPGSGSSRSCRPCSPAVGTSSVRRCARRSAASMPSRHAAATWGGVFCICATAHGWRGDSAPFRNKSAASCRAKPRKSLATAARISAARSGRARGSLLSSRPPAVVHTRPRALTRSPSRRASSSATTPPMDQPTRARRGTPSARTRCSRSPARAPIE